MAQGKPRDERKERQWRRWIGEWRTSGLSVRSFCSRRRLAETRFYAWRRVLDRRDAQTPTFVPVRVVADEVSATPAAIELVLAGGPTLRVAPGFDAATLRHLLDLLEGRPPC